MGRVYNILVIICVLFMVLLGSYLYYSTTTRSDLQDLACKDLGFEKYEWKGDYQYCKDVEGNLYYVEMNCNYKYWEFIIVNCEAKEISVGDVRIK